MDQATIIETAKRTGLKMMSPTLAAAMSHNRLKSFRYTSGVGEDRVNCVNYVVLLAIRQVRSRW
jgi:hypothetical protein